MIAILFVGVQIDAQYALMRYKVLARHLGDSGSFFVLNGAPGSTQGQYLFDRQSEGQLPRWNSAVQQQLLTQPKGLLSIELDGETKLLAWQQLPGWNWVIAGEVSSASRLEPITHSRNLFIAIGLALVIDFAVGFLR